MFLSLVIARVLTNPGRETQNPMTAIQCAGTTEVTARSEQHRGKGRGLCESGRESEATFTKQAMVPWRLEESAVWQQGLLCRRHRMSRAKDVGRNRPLR